MGFLILLPAVLITVQEQFGQFKSIDSVDQSACSATEGIWYYERTPGSEHEVRVLP